MDSTRAVPQILKAEPAPLTDVAPVPEPLAFADDPLWHKDAVIYQLHVKAFYDSNQDGVGDFRSLTERLDYIQELGVNTIWVQPFYPSPMLDDGYDVADYTNVFPAYGTRNDFRHFVREAHRRGLKVITELIINHTSDQHAWFQAARRAPKGSTKRDYYVWSDDPNKYAGTRIIFTDTESSNWAWDGVAQAHYWHRFFSHQPDLNFDNPNVLRAVFRVMRFWLDLGVDGFRLDAIPYLIEREGTDNQNLPETHDVIRKLRAAIDARYPGRILLAEANLWPEDVRQYFGNSDECQMAYHFPLMPRVYMSIAMEDRHPIVEIMAQTPPIPDDCQWAIFLRNHDELTLEMVTDRERDYMYKIFANDPRMRLNVGIRRRLAPLMDNSRTQIELISFLLMTLPGAPILYYGDEIGMGDNIYLGDRNSVRTPMQWSPDRNAGFSRADPQRLYLPPVMDALYGYQTVNVEAQLRSPSSLLHWTRRIIAVRRSHRAFSRGSLTFLSPGNRKILAFVREHEGEVLLCVANLSRVSQAVELDLLRFEGRVPVEIMGKEAFPPVGKLPYLLTLSGHGYFAFRLATDTAPPVWHDERMPYRALPMLVLASGWGDGSAAQKVVYEIGDLIINATHERLREEIVLPYLRNRPLVRGQSVAGGRPALRSDSTMDDGGRLLVDGGHACRPGSSAAAALFLPACARLGNARARPAREAGAVELRKSASQGAHRRTLRRLRQSRIFARAGASHRRRKGNRAGQRVLALHDDLDLSGRGCGDRRGNTHSIARAEQYRRVLRQPAFPERLPAVISGPPSRSRDGAFPHGVIAVRAHSTRRGRGRIRGERGRRTEHARHPAEVRAQPG